MYVFWKSAISELHTIPKKEVESLSLQYVDHLKNYVKQKLSINFDIEIVYKDRVRTAGVLPWSETSENNPIYIYLKHIINTKNDNSDQDLTDTFFQQRDINLREGILLDRKFQGCLDQLEKIPDIDAVELRAFLKAFKKHKLIYGASKYPLINRFLENSFESDNYTIQNAYEIKADEHKAIADFIIYDEITRRAIIVGEGKHQDILAGVIQNFDQERSYSMSIQGKKFQFVYGVATSLEKWVFTCYVVPKDGMPAKYDNFLVSEEIPLEIESGKPTLDSIKKILGYLQGLLEPQIDKIVAKE